MEPFFAVDQAIQKREKQKARELRQSPWWKNQQGKGICFYCQKTIHPRALTMDHKTPIARGGRSTKGNLVPCCKECNTEKKHMTVSEWVALRESESNSLACAKFELY